MVPGQRKEECQENEREDAPSADGRGKLRAVHAVLFPNLQVFEIVENTKNSIILNYPSGFPSQIQGNFPQSFLPARGRFEI
jgi:hypothetical protein